MMTAVATTATGEETETAHFDFDAEFQTKIAALAMRDDEFLRRTSHILKPEFFENVGEAKLVELSLKHFAKYDCAPDNTSMAKSIRDAVNNRVISKELAPLVVSARRAVLSADVTNRAFIEDNVVTFARQQAVTQAIIRSLSHLKKNEYAKIEDLIQEAVSVGINEDGNAYDYYGSVINRTALRIEKETGVLPPQGITTGDRKLDSLLYHRGWGRKELTSIMGGAKSGKCVVRDTMIFTEDGLAEIGDYVPDDLGVDEFKPHVMSILGMNGVELTSHVYNSGMNPTIKVATRRGFDVEGTYHHPMLVMNEKGQHVWKRLDEIKIGDFMVGQRNQQVYGSKTDLSYAVEAAENNRYPAVMTEALAHWLALVMSGACYENGFLRCHVEKFNLSLSLLSESLFGLDVVNTQLPKSLLTYLDAIGLELGKFNEIPKSLLSAPRHILNTYLIGLTFNFHVGNDVNCYDFGTMSQKAVKQIKMLLLNEDEIIVHEHGTRYRSLLIESDNDNYFYDEVTEINHGEALTVDLTVPETHSFFANGLISHNTTALINFARMASWAKHNVLYVTLEVGAGIISDRLDASVAGVVMKELGSKASSVGEAIKKAGEKAGHLIIQEFGSGTCSPNMIRQLIQKYKNPGRNSDGSYRPPIKFDLIVVDYADIMAPNHRTNDPIENSKSVYVDLRAIAFEENVAVLTATQTNREGFKSAVAKAEHVSDDFNKVRTVDLMISINKTEEEAARGEARLYFAASRNQESGFTVVIKQNIAMMRFLEEVVRVE